MQDRYGCQMGYLEPRDTGEEGKSGAGSTFFLRLFLSLLIFCGFFWMHKEKRTVFGYQPEAVAEAVSQNTDLQAFPKSVRMEK